MMAIELSINISNGFPTVDCLATIKVVTHVNKFSIKEISPVLKEKDGILNGINETCPFRSTLLIIITGFTAICNAKDWHFFTNGKKAITQYKTITVYGKTIKGENFRS